MERHFLRRIFSRFLSRLFRRWLRRRLRSSLYIAGITILLMLFGMLSLRAAPPVIDGCTIFPADNIWNTPIDTLPVDPNSAAYVNTIGADAPLKMDFGSGIWPPDTGGPIGIPFITVPGSQPKVAVTFDYEDESDLGPYPIPPDAPIEGGPNADGDRHILIIDRDNCILYELFYAYPQTDGTWTAGSGAIFDLNSNALRPDTWTSADAAGLPILPGLVRYDEVASGEITHALRFTVPQTRSAYIWPARHEASDLTGAQYPPMGQYFRLKANYDISGFSPQAQVILRALKKYGMILADNGSSWYVSGAPDERWDNDILHELGAVKGSDFEAVDVSSLMVDPNSGRVSTGPSPDGPQNLSVELSAGVPVIPTFHWTPGAAGTYYRLWLENDSGKVVDEWFTASQICDTGGCTATPAQIPSYGLLNGVYHWWAQAYISANNQPRSEEQQFEVSVPAAAPPAGFTVTTTQFPAIFSWPDSASALYYQVFISSAQYGILHWNWHAKADVCEGNICSITPIIALGTGENYFYIQSWGPAGFSTGGIQNSGWDGVTFELTPPPLASNLAVTNANSGNPTFTWAHSDGALFYQVWVGVVSTLDTKLINWYAASPYTGIQDLACTDDNTCTLTPSPALNLPGGTYNWYVQAWGHGGITTDGALGWATGDAFTVGN